MLPIRNFPTVCFAPTIPKTRRGHIGKWSGLIGLDIVRRATVLVSYIGNFDPPWSTENHVAQALVNIGYSVQMIPEQRLEWAELPDLIDGDVLLWTRTAGFDPPDEDRQRSALEEIAVPKVGYHLDRWWGLNRESSERGPRSPNPSPFFTHLDLLCTADGGHQDRWAVRHEWFPPAVLSDETAPGAPKPRFRYDVAFVGNLQDYGHEEWRSYRHELFMSLRTWYRGNFTVFPGRGRPQIRGRDLADLYASVKVLVGDSCLAGDVTHYWSDRIPETTGRGGFLIHPEVEGLKEHHPDLITYPLGEFDKLRSLIDEALGDPVYREANAEQNRAHTLANHLYEHRMQRLIELLS